MATAVLSCRHNAEFSMKTPEIEIENYDEEKLLDVDGDDKEEGNEASE